MQRVLEIIFDEFRKHNPSKKEQRMFQTYLKERIPDPNTPNPKMINASEQTLRKFVDRFFEAREKGEIFISPRKTVEYPFYEDFFNVITFMRYLSDRHDNVCTQLIESDPETYSIYSLSYDAQTETTDLKMYIDNSIFSKSIQTFNVNELRKFFEKVLEKCMTKKYRFFAMYVALHNVKGSHANILLFDLKKKTFELYDPHGESMEKFNRKKFEKQLKKALPEWKYIEMDILCPKLSFQAIENMQPYNEYIVKLNKRYGEELGFCVAWSFFYLDLRLKYPNDDPKELQLKAISKLGKRDMVKFIVGYIDEISRYTLNFKV